MKKIPWHNPAQQTPPKGYRLLIPEEVDGRFRTSKLPTTHFYSEADQQWDSDSVSAALRSKSYAVPSDTPLPEGYTLIDGDVWQMNGWTAHTPGESHIPRSLSDCQMEVMLRNGERVTALGRNHRFGRIPKEPRAEIIGWRVVVEGPSTMGTEECAAQQAHKPMTATEVMERNYPKDRAAERTWYLTHTLIRQLEDVRLVLDENQRLKNELADAQATLRATRITTKEVGGLLLEVLSEVSKTQGYLRGRIQNGEQVFGWLEEVSNAQSLLVMASTKLNRIKSL